MEDLKKIQEFFSKPLESVNEGPIEDIQKKLDALGVKYEMSKTDKVRPFKAIYKPTNKSDEFYDKFEDIVDLYNLGGVVKTSMNEGAEEIMDAYNDVLDLVKKHSRRLSDDDSYAFGLKLKAWFNKNILDEATKEEEGYSQFLKTDDNPEGKTKGLDTATMNKILMNVIKDIEETKRLGEGMIEEELCPKGKAYRKRRMAAGEKSSAYLSGRAVKVCKGQMKG